MDPREKPARLDEKSVPSLNPLEGMEPTGLVPIAETPASAGEAEGAETLECPFCGNRLAVAGQCALCGWRVTLPPSAAIEALRKNARTGYLLQAVSMVCGCSSIFGLMVAYAHRGKARGTWLESHYEWQIETFWTTFGMGIVAMILGSMGTSLLGAGLVGRLPGALALAAMMAWFAHRVVKGWTRLSDGDPVTDY